MADQPVDALFIEGLACQRGIAQGINPLAEAQAHQHHFIGLFGEADIFDFLNAMAFCLDRGNPRAGGFQGSGRALVASADPAMRAGSDADIIAIVPVEQIVAALRARTGMVGNFIVGQTGIGADGLRRLIKGG